MEIDQISQYVLEGTVATEDERFYEHGGFDLWGIARAVVVNLTGSSREGASTITAVRAQYDPFGRGERHLDQAQSARDGLSMKIEEVYSKDEIPSCTSTRSITDRAPTVMRPQRSDISKRCGRSDACEAATLIGIPSVAHFTTTPSTIPTPARIGATRTEPHADEWIHYAGEYTTRYLELNVTERSNDGIYKYPYFTSYVRE